MGSDRFSWFPALQRFFARASLRLLQSSYPCHTLVNQISDDVARFLKQASTSPNPKVMFEQSSNS